MVNASDVFVCIVVGLAVPLAMLDGVKALAGAALADQSAGFQLESRPLVWLLAIPLGPGLFVERMLIAWRQGELSPTERINALVIALGWAAIYGFVVLGIARMAVPA